MRRWSDSTRTLALYVLSSPHRNLEGLFCMPLNYAQADLGWTPAKTAKAMDELERDGFLKRDPETDVVLITRALKYQAPKSDKQLAGAVKALAEVPKSSVHAAFIECCDKYAPELAKRLSEGESS